MNITEEEVVLESPLGNTKLINYYVFDNAVGYAVLVDNCVVEFAEKPSPYYLFDYYSNNTVYYYDFANYGIVSAGDVICFDSEGYIIDFDSVAQNINDNVSLMGTLPGVTPQLQGSYNCVATALSNIIWYWGNHGRSSLIAGRTFVNVKDDITTHFVNYGSGFANDVVINIANVYGSYVSPTVSFSGGAVWNNSSATLTNDIDSGYPCMLGFKAGSSYSSTSGHMTMCFGYYYSGGSLYVVLADGHSNSSVTKVWSTYNDCTIRVRPN
jgi:hypothetical protein